MSWFKKSWHGQARTICQAISAHPVLHWCCLHLTLPPTQANHQVQATKDGYNLSPPTQLFSIEGIILHLFTLFSAKLSPKPWALKDTTETLKMNKKLELPNLVSPHRQISDEWLITQGHQDPQGPPLFQSRTNPFLSPFLKRLSIPSLSLLTPSLLTSLLTSHSNWPMYSAMETQPKTTCPCPWRPYPANPIFKHQPWGSVTDADNQDFNLLNPSSLLARAVISNAIYKENSTTLQFHLAWFGPQRWFWKLNLPTNLFAFPPSFLSPTNWVSMFSHVNSW